MKELKMSNKSDFIKNKFFDSSKYTVKKVKMHKKEWRFVVPISDKWFVLEYIKNAYILIRKSTFFKVGKHLKSPFEK